MVEEKRSLGFLILMNIITCGFYSWYFYYKLANDMNIVCYGDGDETSDLTTYILFSILTCGFYSLYAYYKVGHRQAANAQRYNIQIQEDGTTVLIWLILGSWFFFVGYFVAMYIIIKNMNALAYAYNRKSGNGQPNVQREAYAPPAQSIPVQSVANIYCERGEFAGNTFPIRSGENIIIGRDNSCNIRFNSNTPNLSRRHCAVSFDGSSVYVTDMGSSFGTFLTNGTRLVQGQRTPVPAGSGFYLGTDAISFFVR